FDINTKSKYTYFNTAFMENGIILCPSFEHCAFKIVVGGQKREFGVIQIFYEPVQTIVKLVITKSPCIISQFRHEVQFQFTSKKVKIWCSLKHIAGIQQQKVLF